MTIGLAVISLYALVMFALIGDGKCNNCGSAHARDPRGCKPYLPPEPGFPRQARLFPGWFAARTPAQGDQEEEK